MKEKEGLQNAARYAIQPNMWGFCGEDTSQIILRNYVTERSMEQDIVKETLSGHGFPHLNAFLRAISSSSKEEIFNDELVQSYWIGNDLTERVGVDNKSNLVLQYKKQISDEFGIQLEIELPESIYLTHLSQVALIAASGYTQLEKTKIINQCMIAYGRVINIDRKNKTADIERDYLQKMKGTGYEVVTGKQKVKIDPDLTPELIIGDNITVHLGYLAAKVSNDQAKNLRYWTRKVAELV